MHIQVTDEARSLDLREGEWQLFCPTCGYRAEKNTAQSSKCPECQYGLHLVEETETES